MFKQSPIIQSISVLREVPGQNHPYHLVDPSPWPLQTSVVLGTAVASFVLTFAGTQGASILFFLSVLSLILHMSLWFSDVVGEGTFNGDHTAVVLKGLVLGMSLFILTEVIFFGFIFWGYLHSSLSPAVELGSLWPPLGIDPLEAKAIPTLNTALLLSSGLIHKPVFNSKIKNIFNLHKRATTQLLPFNSPRVKSLSRIVEVPSTHHINILSIIFGSLLGDGSLERDGKGTRVSFYQSQSHKEYLLYIHSLVSALGYCNLSLPNLKSRLNMKGEVRYIIRFRTYTYASFNWIYNSFYPNNISAPVTNLHSNRRTINRHINGIKRVPICIGEYLTPLALAICCFFY